MARGYTIAPMEEAHLKKVAEIEGVSNVAPWSEGSFASELRNNDAHYLVALSGGDVIGYGGYWAIVDEAHVTTLAVHPEHRKKGVGIRLMTTLLLDAVNRGIRCSTLEVRASNNEAIMLYEKLGYVRCGIRKRYYPNNREDAVVMWLFSLENKRWTT